MKPSIGRIAHYKSYGTPGGEYESRCVAAIVTELCDNPDGLDPKTSTPCVSLLVFNPEGMFFKQHLPQDEKQSKGGTWHWPEREEVFYDQ